MTRRDLMLRTPEKVTGQPRPHLEKVLDTFAASAPGKGRWNEEVPLAEQFRPENDFAAEAPGILAWYVKILQNDAELREDRIHSIQKESVKKYRRGRRQI